ncbi:MAG: Fe-S cluster assembly protein SufD [Vicinamibacterales bacterium]|jgi:Fe-S cluster assembly protein SufD|nr:Fe-S cluster assembly protein SufD [Vicinamibacterales bacterium]
MTQVATIADSYAEQFGRFKQQTALPGALASLRDEAFSCFERLGFPTTRLEDWRFTNVAPIAETAFVAQVAQSEGTDHTRLDFDALHLPRLGGPELVFVNGTFAPALSTTDGLPAGARARSLATVLAKHDVDDEDGAEAVASRLGQLARIESRAFTALNTAFLRDGAVIEVPPGVVVETPIHLLFVTRSHTASVLSQPRVLLVAGENSQVRVVESHAGDGETPYLSNTVTEIVAGDHAGVDHYTLVREADAACRVGSLHASLGRASNFSSHTISLGGAFVRNEASVVLGGEGAACTLNGLYLANGRQLVDNQTTIDHAQPHCDSHELYKGILDGRSRGVFNGKIIVRLDAQKTDAKQSNKALLLSEDAQVTSKPQLEIFADDVKCTHGATVGQLDEDSLFYLRSRALSHEQARQLLIHAFAADLLGHIKVEAIRRQLDALLLERLPVGGA